GGRGSRSCDPLRFPLRLEWVYQCGEARATPRHVLGLVVAQFVVPEPHVREQRGCGYGRAPQSPQATRQQRQAAPPGGEQPPTSGATPQATERAPGAAEPLPRPRLRLLPLRHRAAGTRPLDRRGCCPRPPAPPPPRRPCAAA